MFFEMGDADQMRGAMVTEPDLHLRQAIKLRWMGLPQEKRTLSNLRPAMRLGLEETLEELGGDIESFASASGAKVLRDLADQLQSGQGALGPEMLGGLMGDDMTEMMLRQAIQACWLALPGERQHRDEVQAQLRRLLERALDDFEEDLRQFGTRD